MAMIDLDENGNENIKVILIGNSGVGKTNLINVSSGGKFNPIERSTLSSSFIIIKLKVENRQYNLQIWDTIGQEKLRALSKLFFKNSKIVVFVYDITNKESFLGLKDWHQEVNDILGDDTIKGVLGNKIDLFHHEEVKDEEGEEYANTLNALFRTTSAKTEPKGFTEFLQELINEYDKKMHMDTNNKNNIKNNTIKINSNVNNNNNKKKKKKLFC
jgi:small GTP-binding protein